MYEVTVASPTGAPRSATAVPALILPVCELVISAANAGLRLTSWVVIDPRSDVPTLGICWGHQFLASLSVGAWSTGRTRTRYRTVHRRCEDPLFSICRRRSPRSRHTRPRRRTACGCGRTARNQYGVQAFGSAHATACSSTPSTTARQPSGSSATRTSPTNGGRQ